MDQPTQQPTAGLFLCNTQDGIVFQVVFQEGALLKALDFKATVQQAEDLQKAITKSIEAEQQRQTTIMASDAEFLKSARIGVC